MTTTMKLKPVYMEPVKLSEKARGYCMYVFLANGLVHHTCFAVSLAREALGYYGRERHTFSRRDLCCAFFVV